MNSISRIAVAAAMSLALVACAKKVREQPPVQEPIPQPEPVVTLPVDDGRYAPEDLDTDSCLRQRVVYFDFDEASLRPEYQAILACHAKYLQDRDSARVTLESHADERGTREYNLGLGERRGNAVQSGLTANGAPLNAISVVSYGEERPVCNTSDESCWQQNRRVEIVYTAR